MISGVVPNRYWLHKVQNSRYPNSTSNRWMKCSPVIQSELSKGYEQFVIVAKHSCDYKFTDPLRDIEYRMNFKDMVLDQYNPIECYSILHVAESNETEFVKENCLLQLAIRATQQLQYNIHSLVDTMPITLLHLIFSYYASLFDMTTCIDVTSHRSVQAIPLYSSIAMDTHEVKSHRSQSAYRLAVLALFGPSVDHELTNSPYERLSISMKWANVALQLNHPLAHCLFDTIDTFHSSTSDDLPIRRLRYTGGDSSEIKTGPLGRMQPTCRIRTHFTCFPTSTYHASVLQDVQFAYNEAISGCQFARYTVLYYSSRLHVYHSAMLSSRSKDFAKLKCILEIMRYVSPYEYHLRQQGLTVSSGQQDRKYWLEMEGVSSFIFSHLEISNYNDSLRWGVFSIENKSLVKEFIYGLNKAVKNGCEQALRTLYLSIMQYQPILMEDECVSSVFLHVYPRVCVSIVSPPLIR